MSVMTTMEAPSISLGIAIPDTADELLAMWGLQPQLVLIGETWKPKRRWWHIGERQQQDLHAWPLPSRLPASLSWAVDVRCVAFGLRRPDGVEVPLDKPTCEMYPRDTFVLGLRD